MYLCEFSDSFACALIWGAQYEHAQIRAGFGCGFVRRILPFLVFAIVAGGFALAVYSLAYRANLNQLQRTGTVQLEQAADRLLGQLAPFQQLPNLLVRHPTVVDVLKDPSTVNDANNFLANTALTVGADAIFVLNTRGRVVAASDFERPYTELGREWGNPEFVRRALSGALGFERGIDRRTGARDFFVSRGVIDGVAPPIGAIVIRVDVAQLEFEWEGDQAVIAFFDSANIVFVTNRVELRSNAAGTDLRRHPRDAFYGGVKIADFPFSAAGRDVSGVVGQSLLAGVLPANALVLSEHMPRVDLTAQIFLDVQEAAQNARVLAYLSLALMASAGAVLIALNQRRRRLSDRLQVEESANVRLEARVEERTAQLQAAQDQLVQAGKLSALGQMSAGISHEVNQPLAAIRNFAANGVKLIERDRLDEASDNLGLITQQVDRINRIIKNLRGFARNEVEVAEPVDLNVVLTDAKRLADKRLRDEGVTLNYAPAGQAVMVMGGPVRLQQVIVNLMNNAMDAMAEGDEKQLSLSVEQQADTVRLRVADTGAGLADPERVFEPFYTTKDVGASKGLGLGLSISYGIIGSFGGQLSCRNLDRGAEFCVELRRAS